MLSLEEVRKSLNDSSLSDDEVLEIRDQLYSLAEIVFEKWQADRKANISVKQDSNVETGRHEIDDALK